MNILHLDTLAETRQRLERGIETLIALLDLIDGDADLEPSLSGWNCWAMDDREDESELLEDGHDREFDPGEFDASSDDIPGGSVLAAKACT